MRKFIKSMLVAVLVVATAVAGTGVAHAWGEQEYTGNGKPQFNIYTNVPNVGDEHDFLRVGIPGTGSANFSNNQEMCDGQVKLSLYIHNGAPEGFNGTDNKGTGVATGTKLAVNMKNSKDLKAVISANNAASVTDSASITCKGEAVELEYVADSAKIASDKRATTTLNKDELFGNGTLIGTFANDGVVPGCWDFRQYVTIVVKVKKIVPPTPPKPPVTPPVTPEQPTPTELPKTGAGDIAALFAVTTVAGAVAYRVYVARRLSRQ